MMRIESEDYSVEEFSMLVEQGHVYVILDACDAPGVPSMASRLGEDRAISLYNGTSQEDYWAIAPYLCKADAALFHWIQQSLWSEPWGIAAISDADFETVRTHFRKFLVVQSPEGEYWYFRFYDPRVLPVFLESSNDEELMKFFGPIRGFAVHHPPEMKLRLMRTE